MFFMSIRQDISNDNMSKLAIGIITYGESAAKYLPHFFDSLKKQTFVDYKIYVSDNTEKENNKNRELIDRSGLDIDFEWSGANIGFARAYNKMIDKAIVDGCEYFLVINNDVVLKKNAVQLMVEELENDPNLGSVSPKIYKWNFDEIENDKLKKIENKEEVIDTCGIILKKGLRFVDLGQGEADKGQFDNMKILGPSGACGLYRLSSLERVAHVFDKENIGRKEYFDELMFMYKEDADLAYRLYLSKIKTKLVSRAIVYHDRTVAGKGENYLKIIKSRWGKSRQQIRWSFLNQQIIYWKYWKVINWKEKLMLVWHQVRLLIYIVLFEQYLFLELPKLYVLSRKSKKVG